MKGIVRIGKVSSANYEDRTVRVHFPDVGIVSGWLKVVKSAPFVNERHQEQKTEETGSGGILPGAFDSHAHGVVIKPWFPEIGDTVLCIFASGFNADGYVIGGL